MRVSAFLTRNMNLYCIYALRTCQPSEKQKHAVGNDDFEGTEFLGGRLTANASIGFKPGYTMQKDALP